MVPRTPQNGRPKPSQPPNPLVFRFRPVISNVPRNDHRIRRHRQPRQIPKHPPSPLATAFPRVNVKVADLRNHHHPPTLSAPPRPPRRPKPDRWRPRPAPWRHSQGKSEHFQFVANTSSSTSGGRLGKNGDFLLAMNRRSPGSGWARPRTCGVLARRLGARHQTAKRPPVRPGTPTAPSAGRCRPCSGSWGAVGLFNAIVTVAVAPGTVSRFRDAIALEREARRGGLRGGLHAGLLVERVHRGRVGDQLRCGGQAARPLGATGGQAIGAADGQAIRRGRRPDHQAR